MRQALKEGQKNKEKEKHVDMTNSGPLLHTRTKGLQSFYAEDIASLKVCGWSQIADEYERNVDRGVHQFAVPVERRMSQEEDTNRVSLCTRKNQDDEREHMLHSACFGVRKMSYLGT